jgi:hypothetical protein
MAYNETPTDWIAMFLKNREARIKFVKTDRKEEDAPTMEEVLNPDSVKLIEEAGKRFVKYVAITVVVTAAAIKVADTLSEIAVKKTKSADKE